MLLVLVSITLTATPGAAYTLVDDDEMRLDLKAWARAGYTVVDDVGTFGHAPYVNLARLAAAATYKPYGRAVVQVGGASGDVQLVDLVAELRPTEPITIRFGRFKVPTSADYLISAPDMAFVNRSLLTGFVQKRLVGGELVGSLSSETLTATAQVGWFQPTPAARDQLFLGEGNFISTRATVDFSFGLGLHVAYLSLVLADNVPVPPPDDPTGPLVRPVQFPELLDIAVTYGAGPWNIYLEGIIAPDTDAESDGAPLPWGAYLHVVRSFPVSDVVELEPGARYGLVSVNDRTTHRVTAGLRMNLVGTKLSAMTNYELMAQEDLIGHAGYLQIQAGF